MNNLIAQLKPMNRPEEIANRFSGTGIFMYDIRFNTGFLHTFFDQNFKNGHATRYTASYGIINITRETEER
jgi:hypothetical protein